MTTVSLRELTDRDRSVLFESQKDPEANQMAAFTSEDPNDEAAHQVWWGKIMENDGITTEALRQLLQVLDTRPIHAHVATDNKGSLRVLEKCGFVIYGTEKGFANARGQEINEYVLRKDSL